MAFSERLAPRTTTQVVEGKTSLTQNKTVKERKERKKKYRGEDDGAATPLVLPRAKRPSTAQHGDVTVGTVLEKRPLYSPKAPNLCSELELKWVSGPS